MQGFLPTILIKIVSFAGDGKGTEEAVEHVVVDDDPGLPDRRSVTAARAAHLEQLVRMPYIPN